MQIEFVANKEQSEILEMLVNLASDGVPKTAILNRAYINDPEINLLEFKKVFS